MAINFEMPTDMTGDNRINKAGIYHFHITDQTESPTKRFGDEKGALIPGAFEVTAAVVQGTSQHQGRCTEEGKSHHFMFFHPNPSQKETARNIYQKKIARLFAATMLVKQDSLGKQVSVELAQILGRQFCAKMSFDKEGKYLDLNFYDIWHVDDIEVADVPKSPEHLAIIPAELRLIGGKPHQPDSGDARTEFSEPVTTTGTEEQTSVSIEDLI